MDRRRIIDVSWDGEQRVERIVGLSIQAQNRKGLLELISGVFASNDADIVQANIKTGEDDRAHGVFRARVRNLSHLTRLMNSLKNVKGVETVERLGTIRGRAN